MNVEDKRPLPGYKHLSNSAKSMAVANAKKRAAKKLKKQFKDSKY
jgi:hypothetical protein